MYDICRLTRAELQVAEHGLKGRIVAASRASVYTNAIFASQNACWEFPNPLCSASYRCRLRVPAERFFDGVHDSVVYPLDTDPLKRKSADNDFVSTRYDLFTFL